jgi:hypothetical protein
MLHHSINLVDIFGQAGGKAFQGSDCEPLRVHFSCHLARLFTRLGVSSELVEEFARGCPEETLNDRSKMGLLRGSVHFRHEALGEKRLKIDAAKLRAMIDHNFLGRVTVTLHMSHAASRA